ncbi:hypothetical protein GZL_08043 [Streptomyces sp. 769]|nr:hypothetical protein GZL_08043 [Streptomyces sp. 769]
MLSSCSARFLVVSVIGTFVRSVRSVRLVRSVRGGADWRQATVRRRPGPRG